VIVLSFLGHFLGGDLV